MKFHIIFSIAIIAFLGNLLTATAQVDAAIGQITNSVEESFAGGVSGDGRFVVFESTGNLATENPRNTDGNREIFLFDYAQRRIFQITDTTDMRVDAAAGFTQVNTRVAIVNARPTISRDGRWIAFGSNATTSTPTAPNATNPGSFNADSFTVSGVNPLTSDGNTEMWLYAIPAVAPANLSSGAEIAFTNLNGGAFTRVTNTLPSRLPAAGTTSAPPVIGDDNRDASINDDGGYIAFVSNRDLVPDATFGNAAPNNNDEIFTYARVIGATNQITVTARGTIAAPKLNQNPTISGNGGRVAFVSNADNPIRQMTGGSNADGNNEIFYADIDLSTGGATAATVKRQVTTTTRNNPGDLVNILDNGRRMSRDGRYIAFDSFADLAGEHGGANQAGFALFVFDNNITTGNPFRRVGPRSDADAGASGGDVARYPGFTDLNAGGTPETLIFETRANITAAGAVAAAGQTGLNPGETRPPQLYAYTLSAPVAAATFTRLTTFPAANLFIPSTQALTTDTRQRFVFNLSLTELGTGNTELQSEAFYFLLPTQTTVRDGNLSFATGASRIPVSASPVPTPTATPTPSPTPSVSPTPTTPPAVQGVSPGMLAIFTFPFDPGNPATTQTAVGSLSRSFTLPIELSGVTLTVNGAAAGIQSVSSRQIVFVVPPGLVAANNSPTVYPVVVNNNGSALKGSITVVPVRPDIFVFPPQNDPVGNPPRPGIGANRAQLYNVTNSVPRTEPFTITTLRLRGGRRVPTVFRLFITGVKDAAASNFTVRIGNQQPSTVTVTTGAILRAPGVYSFDFTLPSTYQGLGDVPIIVSITVNGVVYSSRLDDTAPRFRIL